MESSISRYPLVSVIIPTYNRAGKVQYAIESVLKQQYSNIQIIVVDDGSADNTAEIINRYEGVEYYWQPNGGQASARNTGLYHAKGSVIASLDSDDRWEPEFLSRCVEKLESDNLDFVFANWNQSSKEGKSYDFLEGFDFLRPFLINEKEGWVTLSYPNARNLYIHGCPSPSSSLVMRRSSMKSGWDKQIKIGDDWCLLLSMILAKECKVAFTMDKLWTKNVDTINVFDGRTRIEVVKYLYIKDLKLFMERFSDLLTKNELEVMQKMHMEALVEHAKHSLIRDFNLYQFLVYLKRSMVINASFTLKTLPSFFIRGFERHMKQMNKLQS